MKGSKSHDKHDKDVMEKQILYGNLTEKSKRSKKISKKSIFNSPGKVIDQYPLSTEGLEVNVKIVSEKGKPIYKVSIPKLGPGSLALLNEIRESIVTKIDTQEAEKFDQEAINKLKIKFRKEAESLLSERILKIDSKTKELIVSILLHEMLGIGEIEFLLSDSQLEEIVVNSSAEPVRVFHKKYGWLETNITVSDENQIKNYSNIIGRRVGRQITILTPLLDAHLVSGDRANAILYPISTKGNSLTIRMFSRDPWSVVDLIKNKTCTSEIFALLWLAIQYEMNILISGGTASGKTTLLNVCMPFIPPNHRLVSIEQTRELQLPKFLFWTPMVTRLPNPEGKGEINMLDLLINSLRMRPDRIVLGEIRRKEEAEVLFEAMHTGHSVYATVHADSISETIRRLINPPIEVPSNLLNAIHLNVVMFRDRRKEIRRVLQIGEIISSEEKGAEAIRSNLIYRWRASTDTFVTHGRSLRLFDELSRFTGFTLQELNKDLKTKKTILDSMVKNNLRRVDQVGELMNSYYLDEDNLLHKLKLTN